MKNLILIFFILITLNINANEKSNKVIEPTGEIKFKNLRSFIDNDGNIFEIFQFKLYSLRYPAYKDIFNKTEDDEILFSKYHKSFVVYRSLLILGITSISLMSGFSAFSVLFIWSLSITPSVVLFSVLLSLAGLSLVSGIVFFIIMFVYYYKTRKLFNLIIENYNNRYITNKSSSLNISIFKICL